ncbi:hypothetical protein RRG08_023027 [Elysia crispata]|uniref:Uncharacterized protein n=1 Tax=Elysia crispata TaxID=231223 RepID=A0AAE1CN84_9GAST|nr:hypothetical protein RRG08_023027 [Elysia crispata]
MGLPNSIVTDNGPPWTSRIHEIHVYEGFDDVVETLTLAFSIALLHVLCQPRPRGWRPGQSIQRNVLTRGSRALSSRFNGIRLQQSIGSPEAHAACRRDGRAMSGQTWNKSIEAVSKSVRIPLPLPLGWRIAPPRHHLLKSSVRHQDFLDLYGSDVDENFESNYEVVDADVEYFSLFLKSRESLGEPIREKLAVLVDQSQETVTDLDSQEFTNFFTKYECPSNIHKLVTPVLNSEFS